MLRNTTLAFLAALPLALTGCNVLRGESTPSEYVDDVALTTQIKSAMAEDKAVDALDVNVDVKNGKVTLTGLASTSAEKSRAGQIARDVRGVKGVDNQIEIKAKS
jgi:hyperosmotically inducible periplasmic protein